MPAAPITFTINQPDGTSFEAKQKGDETIHWYETHDGYTIIKNKETGWWYYAIPDLYSGFTMGKYKVGSLKISRDQIKSSKGLKPAARQAKKINRKLPLLKRNITFPHSQKIIVIMVEFNDITGKYTKETFQDLFFSQDKRSVANYYNEISYGKFNIIPAFNGVNNGVVGWEKLNQDHPDCERSEDPISSYIKLALDAIKSSDSYIDFSIYDDNEDGVITPLELSLIIVVAGYEASYGGVNANPSVWAHQSILPSPVLLDGKELSYYAMFGEKHFDHQATIGVMVHELGHLMLGLPDLYDTDYTSQGIGLFDVMCGGSWAQSYTDKYPGATPVHPSAWTKEYIGFTTPKIINNSSGLALKAVSNDSTIIKVLTQNSNEYFLIENRYFTGYDSGFIGALGLSEKTGGIAIWHIDNSLFSEDFFDWNSFNNNEEHKLVDIEEAISTQNLDTVNGKSRLEDLYYFGNNSTFNNLSNPDSKLYINSPSGVSIANISAPGTLMTVDILAPFDSPLIPENILLNPSFDSGSFDWTINSNNDIIIADISIAHSGKWFAWLGDDLYSKINVNENLYQDINIPSYSSVVYLQFWYLILTEELTNIGTYDKLIVEIRNPDDNSLLKTLVKLSNLDNTLGWLASEQFNVSDFIGKKIRLNFYAETNDNHITLFLVDDISLFAIKGIETPGLSVSSMSLDFGTVKTGSSNTKELKLSNTGNAQLVVGNLSIKGTDTANFSIINDNCSGKIFSKSDEQTVQIVYTPKASGIKNAVLFIPSNDPLNPVLEIPLTGLGKKDDDKKCFITKIISGTLFEPYNKNITKIKDRDMLNNLTGSFIIKIYYKYSPYVLK
ncbi:MAG: M6 family metalloprotease domain-containing protein [Candidatus Firestonebacteria bacterium]|nr:M6 family metalloprotease domain-containing protein [Candidatus Firestonebacteria bacterium]